MTNMLILDNNKIITFSNKDIYLYDDSFNNVKLIKKEFHHIYDSLKINENTFAYTTYDYPTGYTGYNLNYNVDLLKDSNLYILKIIENNLEEKQFINCGIKLCYFSKKRKILFSEDFKYIYLISFRTIIPEVVQKIRFDSLNMNKYDKDRLNNYNPYMKYFTNFDDDNIYFQMRKKYLKIETIII